ncbi:MAG: hypothetical protein FJ319_12085 [SAR202 cluster bacterium]|nr:hypothetical protein [SAR202 cluster bacterium]
MPPLALPRLVLRRFQADWKLVASVFAGIAFATALGTAAPVFLSALKQLSFNVAVDRLAGGSLDYRILAADMDLSEDSLAYHEDLVGRATEQNLGEIALDRALFFRSDTLLAGYPNRPLPDRSANSPLVSRGYLGYVSGLEVRARFVAGGMPAGGIVESGSGPLVQAAIPAATAAEFGLALGDRITFAPSVGAARVIVAEVVGVFEARDPSDAFWSSFSVLIGPSSISESAPVGVSIDPTEPPLPVYLALPDAVNVITAAYPGILPQVDPVWSVQIDLDRLKGTPMAEVKRKTAAFQREVRRALPESQVSTGQVEGLVDGVERRSILSSIPLLLVTAMMLVCTLYTLAVLVSFLNTSRKAGASLLRTRGVTTAQMLKVNAMEASAIVLLALVVAPLPAVGA